MGDDDRSSPNGVQTIFTEESIKDFDIGAHFSVRVKREREMDVESAIMRAEIASLLAVRESEAVYKRCQERNLDLKGATRRLRKGKTCLAQVQKMREQSVAEVCARLEKTNSDKKSCAQAQLKPDSASICVAHDLAVPSSSIKTLCDVKRILQRARKESTRSVNERSGRAVLPPLQFAALAPLQNLTRDQHAQLALLARWSLNAQPSWNQLKRALRNFDLEQFEGYMRTLCKLTD